MWRHPLLLETSNRDSRYQNQPLWTVLFISSKDDLHQCKSDYFSPPVLNIVFICIHILLLRKIISDHIYETDQINLCSSEIKANILWSGLFVLIRLWQQTKKTSVCIHHCGQLHLSQYSEIEGEAPNLSIILRAFPTLQREAGSSLLMELVLCARGPVQDNE